MHLLSLVINDCAPLLILNVCEEPAYLFFLFFLRRDLSKFNHTIYYTIDTITYTNPPTPPSPHHPQQKKDCSNIPIHAKTAAPFSKFRSAVEEWNLQQHSLLLY